MHLVFKMAHKQMCIPGVSLCKLMVGATKVLVIGGTGVFGSKLVRLLAAAGFNVAIGVRNTAVAHTLMASLPRDSSARCEAVSLDLKALSAPVLRQIQADVVVNTAGPFEAGDYSLPHLFYFSGLSRFH